MNIETKHFLGGQILLIVLLEQLHPAFSFAALVHIVRTTDRTIAENTKQSLLNWETNKQGRPVYQRLLIT